MTSKIIKYYEGQDITLDTLEIKRCLAISLKGKDKAVLLRNIKNLVPEHIDYCFGASNVMAILQNKDDLKSEFLDVWLNRTRYPMAGLIGFSGPEGTILYVVLRKDRCTSIKLLGYTQPALLVNMTLTQEHVDFFLGSGDIEVKLSSSQITGKEQREDIVAWLYYSKYPMSRLLGFYGPEGTLLYIILKKDIFL